MKKLIILFLVISICSIFLIAPRRRKRLKILPPLTKEEISGKRLWKRFTEEEDYEKYPFWPGHEGILPGQAPHGDLHQIYIHPILKDALPIKNKIAPDGSMIIKCNLNAEKDITAFTVMAKVKGYNPEANDWFWVKYSKDGDILAEGKISGCIECHSPVKENDYVIIYQLDKKPK